MKLVSTALRNCAICALPVFACTQSYAQNNIACEPINRPAIANFDFTEDISRWGTDESFDLDSKHYKIRNISVNRLPIFDENSEKENNAAFRWINRVHMPTQQKVILHQLLLEKGNEVNSQMDSIAATLTATSINYRYRIKISEAHIVH